MIDQITPPPNHYRGKLHQYTHINPHFLIAKTFIFMPTTVINVKTALRGYQVYIGRPSNHYNGHYHNHFGNPFSHLPNAKYTRLCNSREEAIQTFREWLAGTAHTDWRQEQRQWILDNMHTLKDMTLACWCKPLACHGDVYVELLDNPVNK